jgi:hypothetical protein
VLYRVPLHEVARWPAWHIQVLEHYLAKEPDPGQRIEILLAQLIAVFINANQKQGSTPKRAQDFMHYRDPWPSEDGRYSEVDRSIIAGLL